MQGSYAALVDAIASNSATGGAPVPRFAPRWLPSGEHCPDLPCMLIGNSHSRLVIPDPIMELDHPQLESIQHIRFVFVQPQRCLKDATCPLASRQRR